jgi:hypothetical protein
MFKRVKRGSSTTVITGHGDYSLYVSRVTKGAYIGSF